MAFTKKTWSDRASEFPNRRILTPVAGEQNTYDVTRDEGLVTNEGQAFNASNMNDLEARIVALETQLQGSINTKSPTNHASTATTYGPANSSNFGHAKVADSGSANAASGTAASPYYVNQKAPTSHASIINTYGYATDAAAGHTRVLRAKDITGEISTPKAYHVTYVNDLEAKIRAAMGYSDQQQFAYTSPSDAFLWIYRRGDWINFHVMVWGPRSGGQSQNISLPSHFVPVIEGTYVGQSTDANNLIQIEPTASGIRLIAQMGSGQSGNVSFTLPAKISAIDLV